ncbi:hypothetical protein TNCV_2271311 [Trichonephila clavipes]|nr:hypothetical protein TNCV_2271311 [Trichonephila clavipes]
MSLSSFRVHQDATGQQSRASTEKGYEHPPPSGCGSMSLSSFRVRKTRADSRVVPRRKKDTNTHRRAAAVGCRCHRSACVRQDATGRPDSRVPRRKKDTNTHRQAAAVGYRYHRFACKDTTGQKSRASTEKVTTPTAARQVRRPCHRSACARRDRTAVYLTEKVTNTRRAVCGRMSLSHRSACARRDRMA